MMWATWLFGFSALAMAAPTDRDFEDMTVMTPACAWMFFKLSWLDLLFLSLLYGDFSGLGKMGPAVD